MKNILDPIFVEVSELEKLVKIKFPQLGDRIEGWGNSIIWACFPIGENKISYSVQYGKDGGFIYGSNFHGAEWTSENDVTNRDDLLKNLQKLLLS